MKTERLHRTVTGGRTFRPIVRVAGLFVAVLGVAAGCSSAVTPVTADPARPNAQTPAIPTPFAALVDVTNDNQRALHDAEERAVAVCMKARGFTYTPLPFKAESPHHQPIGDAELAREHGYGLADGSARGDQAVPENDPANAGDLAKVGTADQHAFQTALLGSVSGPEAGPSPGPPDPSKSVSVSVPGGPTVTFDPRSCVSRGRTAVYGDDARWSQLQATVTQLQNQVYDRALSTDAASDATYRETLDRWRSCMRDRGFSYDRPYGASEVLSQQAASGAIDRGTLRDTEVRVATADAECFTQVGFFPVVADAMARTERDVTDANQGVIVEFQELQRKAIDHAHAPGDSGAR